MDDKTYNAIKARSAYQLYIKNLPKCDTCDSCMVVRERRNIKRICLEEREVIDIRVNHCPKWCPKIN